ncbi:nitroreductase/quinone reductase family protein [Amnibacterium flavum]|uniref:Nitroreductase family deazaflavin-dependent oxidoreductase n=1 Tax=Amnibacterium flavum TaxID=2173173 RepID=A0A2V1HTW5_9MICO|nr:nitroreductase/quinone reductase family protein [Amnibacterium flavum]PVZ93747.1 nitroreductase family deazaflavin-dependent oxidoreductase [Amnibacterium flavum]
MADFNDAIIDEFRSNGGRVQTYGFGDSLLLVHSVGAKSGTRRIHPLMALRDGGDWLIAASAAGQPKHPGWYHNLVASPETVVEVGQDGEVVSVPVRVTDLKGADRDSAWSKFTASGPAFAKYQEKAVDRLIPVLRLTPTS